MSSAEKSRPERDGDPEARLTDKHSSRPDRQDGLNFPMLDALALLGPSSNKETLLGLQLHFILLKSLGGT